MLQNVLKRCIAYSLYKHSASKILDYIYIVSTGQHFTLSSKNYAIIHVSILFVTAVIAGASVKG